MSFDTTSTHDSAIATPTGNATSAPGKRTRTSGLSAPRGPSQQLNGSASSASPTSLHGTGWLAGVLGFGSGNASGDASGGEHDDKDHEHHDNKHHDDNKHHKNKKKHHHEPEVISGGGEGVAQKAEDAGDATGRAAPGSGPEAVASKASALTMTHFTAQCAQDGASSERTTVGVGEKVTFTGSRSGHWTASDGHVKKGDGKTFHWEAMIRPGTATITLRSGNQVTTRSFTVIAPSQMHLVKYHEDSWPDGVQGAGMKTHVKIGPTNVSFSNIQWLEVGRGPTNISGYFTQPNHAPIRHQPNPNWLHYDETLYDHANLYRWPKPWSKGSFTWVIPNKYRVMGRETAGDEFIQTHQVFHILDTKGTTLITKGGAEVRRTP